MRISSASCALTLAISTQLISACQPEDIAMLNMLATSYNAYNGIPPAGYGGYNSYDTGYDGYDDCHECVVSDARLKTGISLVETLPGGLNLYRYSYLPELGIEGEFIGVMAQQLLSGPYQDAVHISAGGYYLVDYGELPVELVVLN